MFDYKIGLVLLVIAMVVQYASLGEFLAESRGKFVFFHKPPLARIAAGVWSILFLWLVGFSVINPYSIDSTFAWICVLFGVLFAGLGLYGCLSANLTVDLDERMCHSTVGWRSISYPLTEAATIVISGARGTTSGTVYSVSLWPESDRKNTFPLAVTFSGSDAQNYADDISRLINVPVG